MLAAALPFIALGLVLTLSSDIPIEQVVSRRLWWSGFVSLIFGLAMAFAPTAAIALP